MIWDIDLCGNITKACTRVNFFVYPSWANLFIKWKIDMYIYLKPFFNIQRSIIIFTIVDDEHMFNYCRFAGPSSYQWRHNGLDGVSNHQPYDCLLKLLFRRRTNKASKLCVTGLWVGNSPVTGEFPAQRVSIADNVSIWWRHHVLHYQVYASACRSIQRELNGEFKSYAHMTRSTSCP